VCGFIEYEKELWCLSLYVRNGYEVKKKGVLLLFLGIKIVKST